MNQNFECFFCTWLRVFVGMNKYCLAFVVFLNIVIATCVRNSKNAAKFYIKLSKLTKCIFWISKQSEFILDFKNFTCLCACEYNSILRSYQRVETLYNNDQNNLLLFVCSEKIYIILYSFIL